MADGRSAKIATTNSQQDVRDALDAIVRCQATDEAYVVAGQAGWRELFPGCVYYERAEMSVDITTARSIIKQAIKDETYSGAEPEDDATCIKEADQLVDMAEQAWGQYIRGPEVETILKLANKMPQNGDAPTEETQTPEATEQPSDEDEQAPEVESLEGVDPELKKIEPWEGYGEDRVSDITDGINIAVQETEGQDLQDLISHIYVYELSHKKRARVIKHIKDTWAKIGGGIAEQTQEAEDGAGDGGAGADSEDSGTDAAADAKPQDEPAAESESQASDAPGKPESKAGESTGEIGGKESQPVEKSAPKGQPGRSGSGEATPFGKDDNPAYRALIEGVERELEAERVHTPKRPSEEIPDLPWRWADISNSDLHDYLMQYSAAAYYAQYIVARHGRIAMHCREAADELHRELLNRADKFDEKGKARPVTVLEAEIEADTHVKSWRKRQRKHEQMEASARREMDGYHKMYESLSRLETMRHNAWERARR